MTQRSDEFDDDKLDMLYRLGANESASKSVTNSILSAASKQARINTSRLHIVEYFLQLITSSRSLAFAAVMVIGISIILQIQFDQTDEIIPRLDSELNLQTQPANISKTDSPVDESVSEAAEPVLSLSPASPAAQSPKPEPAKKMQPAQAPRAPAEPREHLLKQKHIEQMRQKAKAYQEATRKQKQELSRRKKSEAEQKRLLDETPQYFATPPAMDSLQSGSPQPEASQCINLSESDCLLSANCVLANTDKGLICRVPENACEVSFIQAANSAESCIPEAQCRFIKGDCHCDDADVCHCDEEALPQCVPVNKPD